MDDGRTTDHGYTKSSDTNEPKGSGELKLFPIWCNVNFVSVFTALNNTKSKENLTLHHMGKTFIS